MILKYMKKNIEVEAIQVPVEGGMFTIEEAMWLVDGGCEVENGFDGEIYINTLEGTMEASPGDYVIKGVQGELYPCKPDIFMDTYDPV